MYNKSCTNLVIRHQKSKASEISSARKDIWCICPENEAARYVNRTTNRVSKENWTHIRKILYYARVKDNTCLVTSITTAKRNDPTEQHEKNLHQFLDYMATYPNAVVIFHASDMILCDNTDASYLNQKQAFALQNIFS